MLAILGGSGLGQLPGLAETRRILEKLAEASQAP